LNWEYIFCPCLNFCEWDIKVQNISWHTTPNSTCLCSYDVNTKKANNHRGRIVLCAISLSKIVHRNRRLKEVKRLKTARDLSYLIKQQMSGRWHAFAFDKMPSVKVFSWRMVYGWWEFRRKLYFMMGQSFCKHIHATALLIV